MRKLGVHLITVIVATVAGYVGGYVGRGFPERSNEIRAGRLVIVDEQDRIRAAIGVSESRATVELRLADSSGALRDGMTVTADGAASLSIGSPDVKNSIAMVTTELGQAHFGITDASGTPIITLGSLPGGPLGLTIHDGKNHVPRVQAGADKEGKFGVSVSDASGKPVWIAPSQTR